MRTLITTFLCIGILYSSTSMQAQNQQTKLDHYMLKKMKQSKRIGMQAAFISNGQLEWVGSYGLKTYNSDDPVNDSTLFMVASISKPVTALALMKLYDDGKVNLDDPVNDYLPFTIVIPGYEGEGISFRMLLCHVSSIRDNWAYLEPLYTLGKGGGDSPISLEAFLRDYLTENGQYYDAKKNFYNTKPLTEEHYSNIGYALIGLLVERISGMPFNEYMNEAIFKPLEMNNTYWFLKEVPHSNIATPHNLPYKETDFKGNQILTHYGYPEYPSGQLRTTVTDYSKFIQLLLNKGMAGGEQFLKVKTVEEFVKIQYPSTAKWRAISWSYNEFENFIYNIIMERIPSHTGLDPGVSTVVSFNPEKGTAAIVFSNSPTTTLYCEKAIYFDMVRKLLKQGNKYAK